MYNLATSEWGMFQAAYAYLEQSIGEALAYSEGCGRPEHYRYMKFSGKIEALRKIEKSGGDTCSLISVLTEIRKWRNPRIHARVEVHWGEQCEFFLFDAEAGQALKMDPTEIRAQTNRCITLASELNHLAASGAKRHEFEAEFDKIAPFAKRATGASKQELKHLTALETCLGSISARQAVEMIDKYYKDHPELWQQPLTLMILKAMTVSGSPCERY